MRWSLVALLAVASCGDDPRPICVECMRDSDCESDACTCVYDGQRGAQFCSACAPHEYKIGQGSAQNQRYNCRTVEERR